MFKRKKINVKFFSTILKTSSRNESALLIYDAHCHKQKQYVFRLRQKLPIHLHNHSRAAKSALGSVKGCQTFLNGMKAAPPASKALHCCQLPPVTTQHGGQTLFKKMELTVVDRQFHFNETTYFANSIALRTIFSVKTQSNDRIELSLQIMKKHS